MRNVLALLLSLPLSLLAQYTLGDASAVHISPTHGILVAADGMFKCWADGTHCRLSNGLTNGNPLKSTIAVSSMIFDSSNNLYVGSDGSGVYKFPSGSANSYGNWVRLSDGLDRNVIKQIGLNSSSEPVAASRLGKNFRYNIGSGLWTAAASTSNHNVNAFMQDLSGNVLALKQQNGIDISTNGGTTYTAKISASVGGLDFSWCRDTLGGTGNNWIYMGTEASGAYVSKDDGATWTAIGPNTGVGSFALHNQSGCTMAANGRIVLVSSSGQTVTAGYSPTESSSPPVTPSDAAPPWVATTLTADGWQGLSRRTLTAPSNGDIYITDAYHGVLRSVDNGTNAYAKSGNIPLWALNMQGIGYSATDHKLYIGSETAGMYRSTNVINGVSDPSMTYEALDGPYYGHFQSVVEDRGVLLASTNGNGVFRSVDGGRNWIAANGTLPNLFMLRLAIHPITKAVWATTQSLPRHTLQDARTYSGGGAWTTTDFGQTWSAVSLTGLTANTGPNQVCFMTNGDAYGFVKNDAVYKLPNGGSTWSALTAIPSSNIRTAVDILCDGLGTIYVVTGIGFSYVSTDSGVSWTVLSPNGTFPVHGYVNPANNDVYMLHATGAQKSTDRGVTFAAVASLPSRRYAAMMISGITHAYVGEDGQYGIGAIVISTNSGSTYTTATYTLTDNTGAVTVDPFTSARLNGQSNALISPYLGEDPGQTYTITGGVFTVTGATSGCTSQCGIYTQILPQGTNGYAYTAPCDSTTANCGYMQHWVTTTPWDDRMNRSSIDVTCTTTVAGHADGTENVQLGTYIRSRTDPDTTYQGDHPYHFTDSTYTANKKVSIVYNAHPQHIVGRTSSFNWPNDPFYAASVLPEHYYDDMTRSYWDTQGTGWSGKTCAFSNWQVFRQDNEPDEYVSGVTITHTGTDYQVSSQGAKNDLSDFSFYRSTSSMHLNGLSSGTLIGTAGYAAGGNDYPGVYKNFTLAVAPTLYVAIRPNVNILTATNATPIVVGFKVDPMYKDGDAVSIAGGAGNTAVNGTRYVKLVASSVGGSGQRTGSTYELYSDVALATAVAGNGTYTASTAKATATNDFTNFTEVVYTNTSAGVAPTITTSCPLTAGVVGVPYSATMTATGDATITWDTSAGTLPASLSLSSAGVLSGTPTAVASSSFTLRATNSVGNNTLSCSMNVTTAVQNKSVRSSKSVRNGIR